LGERFFQDIALNFSRGGHRPVLNELGATRDFKAREVLAAKIDDLLCRCLLPGFQLDVNRDDFHQTRIRHAHRCDHAFDAAVGRALHRADKVARKTARWLFNKLSLLVDRVRLWGYVVE